MEFITAEQFLKQDKKVQEVFIDWWKPSMGDLYAWGYSDERENDLHKLQACTSELVIELTNDNKGVNEGDRIPLLTEGQLRKFIESKTGAKYIELEHYLKTGYDIYVGNMLFEDLGNDLLQAYWKVAVQIAKKSIDK